MLFASKQVEKSKSNCVVDNSKTKQFTCCRVLSNTVVVLKAVNPHN